MDGMNGALAPSTTLVTQGGIDAAASATSWFASPPMRQHSLKSSIGCNGIGLHGGRPVRLDLHPAEPDTGIVFIRTDLPHAAPIPARYDRVVDTRLCTVLGQGEARIGTVEHLMAALAAAGINNARITVNGPELPILDGSAAEFLFLIDCAGIAAQAAPLRAIEILHRVRVENGAAWAELAPQSRPLVPGFDMACSIDFAAGAIGRQAFALRFDEIHFRTELAAARTFAQAAEIATLRAAGLALGGSLDNALVVDGDAVLNPGGLRMEREFVRHKLLDAVGDLALAGHPIRGRFTAHRGGHALNNQLLRALFAAPASWRYAGPEAGLLSAA